MPNGLYTSAQYPTMTLEEHQVEVKTSIIGFVKLINVGSSVCAQGAAAALEICSCMLRGNHICAEETVHDASAATGLVPQIRC